MKTDFYIGKIIIIAALAVSVSGFCSDLPLPQDFDYSNRCESLLDRGLLWKSNGIFHPLSIEEAVADTTIQEGEYSHERDWSYCYIKDHYEYRNHVKNLNTDQLGIMLIPGTGLSSQAGSKKDYEGLGVQPFAWAEAVYHRNLYVRAYLRITNRAESLNHYTGLTRGIDRVGINSSEVDQSVIGYRKSGINIEYGRSREIWGPLAEDNLILSGYSPPWERLVLQFKYRRFTYRWFFGYLETISDSSGQNINRYMVGRAIEYNNHRNLVVAFGEVSLLAGPNRSPDMAFLNPIAIHIEIEQNDRMNTGNNYADGIIFAHVDWLIIPKLRFTGSLLIDEFQLDDQARPRASDNLGKMARVAYTPVSDPFWLTILASYLRLDTFTYQHSYGYCNWISRGILLGHPVGNDADRISAGFRITLHQPVSIEIQYGRRRWGENSLLLSDQPYSPYLSNSPRSFPSGDLRENRFISFTLDSQPAKRLSVGIKGYIDLNHHGLDSGLEKWTFQLRYQVPLVFVN